MTKGKDRTYNDQRKRQNIQWLKEKTEHTMTKGKDRTYNDQRKRQNIQWPKEKTEHTMTKGQFKRDKGTSNYLQNTIHKTKDRSMWTPQKTRLNSGDLEWWPSPTLTQKWSSWISAHTKKALWRINLMIFPVQIEFNENCQIWEELLYNCFP
jgi:hypothetical protein